MSHGLFGGLFSSRAPHPPVFMGPQTPLQTAPPAEPDRSFEYALDALPANAMFCDRDLILRYLNRASRKTLLSLQQYLPMPVDQLVGQSPTHPRHQLPPGLRPGCLRQCLRHQCRLLRIRRAHAALPPGLRPRRRQPQMGLL